LRERLTWMLCFVEMLTTDGWSRATRSAKLIGAPAGGAAGAMAPGSFCAVCAKLGWKVNVAAVPPRRRAAVIP
jgi:hypothetical protein